LEYASEELRDDKAVVLTAVLDYGSALKFASERLQNDKDVVLAAVTSYGSAIEYASKELQEDRDIILASEMNKKILLKHEKHFQEVYKENRVTIKEEHNIKEKYSDLDIKNIFPKRI